MSKLHPYLKEIFVPGNLVVHIFDEHPSYYLILSKISEHKSRRYPDEVTYIMSVLHAGTKSIRLYSFYSTSMFGRYPEDYVKLATRILEKPHE